MERLRRPSLRCDRLREARMSVMVQSDRLAGAFRSGGGGDLQAVSLAVRSKTKGARQFLRLFDLALQILRPRPHKGLPDVEMKLHGLQRIAPARLELKHVALDFDRKPQPLQLLRAGLERVLRFR